MAYELAPGFDPVRLRKAIWDARFEMPVVERPDRLLIRTSTHFYNIEAEVDRLAFMRFFDLYTMRGGG